MIDSSFCGCENCQHKLCTKKVPIFSGLDDKQLAQVASLIVHRTFAKGEMILMEGAHRQSLIIINKGQAKAFRDTLEGKEQILYIFSEGDFFGEKTLLRNEEATYNVEALEKTSVCTISKPDFQRLLREFPDIGFKVMEELCQRLDRLETVIEAMGAKDGDARVNTVLLEFAQKYGHGHPEGVAIDLPLSRQGIASYIGLTRETVSRKMSALEAEGIIKMEGNKRVIIVDRQALERLSE